MTDKSNHIVIIGGGHNGLVCAAYLARAGKKVSVLEASAQLGGAAITREFGHTCCLCLIRTCARNCHSIRQACHFHNSI